MKDLLELQRKKYEAALETIAVLKEALYTFKGHDLKVAKEVWDSIYERVHYGGDCFNEVYFDKNNYTPGQTFLKNGCKDTAEDFGTSIESIELELYERSKEDEE